MIRSLLFLLCLVSMLFLRAQDTTVIIDEGRITLAEVVVRNNFDYKKLLAQIKADTSFYKAFKNLRVLGFSSYNDIRMLDKSGTTKASLYSKTRQNRVDGCRTMDILEEKVSGDFFNSKREYNYLTPELYASLFFTEGKICGETNIVSQKNRTTASKKGLEKHKEQLKMLFFNPGKKIPGIPFIGDKLDLYDARAHEFYDYRLDIEEFKGQLCYVFSIKPKETLDANQKDLIVVDEMTTWFDQRTLEVLGRNYSLSYKAGVYDFDVTMEVIMRRFNGLIVPELLRYRGNWDVIFKKRERAVFTATLFDFKQ